MPDDVDVQDVLAAAARRQARANHLRERIALLTFELTVANAELGIVERMQSGDAQAYLAMTSKLG